PYAPLVDETLARGCRFVTYSRPGYAGSTRLEGRSVADCATDVEALLAHRALDKVHVVGWAGGGPHALACAALLPGRVAGAATLAGVAPWSADGLAWLDGMAEENLDEFAAAVGGVETLRGFTEPIAADRVDVAADEMVAGLRGLLPDADPAATHAQVARVLAHA